MRIQLLAIAALAASSMTTSALVAHAQPSSADSTARRHTTLGLAIAAVPESFRRLDYLVAGEGALVALVQRGSAADAAQLRAGDLILAINGHRVDETTLFAAVRTIRRGTAFKVELLRDTRWKEVWVTIDG
jgi:S1-C subfamily serine protease